METASGSPGEMTELAKAKGRLGVWIHFYTLLAGACFGGLVGNLTDSKLNFFLASLGMISLLNLLMLLVVYFSSLINKKI